MPHSVECVSADEVKAGRITCFVRTCDGSYLCLDVGARDRVSSVKELVHAKCGVEPAQQRLT